MEEMRVQIEAREPTDGEIRAFWFTLPIDTEQVEELLGIYCYPDCETMADVAYHFIYELNALGEIPPSLEYYIDCEAYGRDLEIEGYFIQTRYGMCEIK